MLRPKIWAVRVIVVSLSNIPCVSINNIAIFSPLVESVARMKGSDHIQIPVVWRCWPPRHAKLFWRCKGAASSSLLELMILHPPSFILPSNNSSPDNKDVRRERRQRIIHLPSDNNHAWDSSSLLPFRRNLRKRFNKNDFPVRKAPTTATIPTLVLGGILSMICARFSSFKRKRQDSSLSPIEIIYDAVRRRNEKGGLFQGGWGFYL